ncbi:MAG: DUF262 domain-containing protein [Bacteroidales bacterium]|nr:DUF262 domain-containing protein [Bacteroidales bacterium]
MNLTEIFLNKLKVETKQVSIDSLFNDEWEVERTIYNPPYQRNYVWDGEKATYFLESILIGTEIPPLIFFRSGITVEIIDGRQRYETILRFLHDELKLKQSGLKKLDVLKIDKKTFSELDEDMQNEFLETQLRVIEFSFASHDGITKTEEDTVKQEIFKRYNTGITPLKEYEIDKAIYFEDDLNAFFKEKLKEKEFHDLFTTLFKYEDKRIEISLKKIRQLLVLHRVPIKYYSIAKQKVTDKYYELLSSQMQVDDIDELFNVFNQKLQLIDTIREAVEKNGQQYNRLISEVLFWAFSIMEDNDIALPENNSESTSGFVDLICKHISAFKMDRSSFSNEIVTRYSIMADYLSDTYNINSSVYIKTSKDFIQQNRELGTQKEAKKVNYQELRINKPEPSSKNIKDICRLMSRNRFLVRPAYQREEVINRKKSSKIIESLLLGIKLPPIFVFKNDDGVSEVIDGQQRILSILAFLGREYLDENNKMVKSKKNNFSLQLKDSILTKLNGAKFDDLTVEQKDKITSFGLWVIEIYHKYNPNFEPLDLFIRLNNKPYPIKDHTFEMWNSYLDRGLIDTIKTSYANNANWFFLRRSGNRMENENNYTVLSYFNYLKLNPNEGSEKGPLDIYKVGSRMAFRLRSKSEISKILENSEKKNDFVAAVNDFEFSFIAYLKALLSDDKDNSDKTLSKNLDEMLGVENGKRTQQSFYVLWHFLNGLDFKSVSYYKKQIRREVRQLFQAMPLDIKVEDFNERVSRFREQYENKEITITKSAIMGDVLEMILSDNATQNEEEKFDFYVRRECLVDGQIEIVLDKPRRKGHYYGCRINREGLSKGYVAAVIRREGEKLTTGAALRVLTLQALGQIRLPLIPLEKQYSFDKMLAYTQTNNPIQRKFFENVLNRMVDEVSHREVFLFQSVSVIDQVEQLGDIRIMSEEQREEQIEKVYYSITKENNGLLAELSAAIGITGMLDNEKN